jgi:hypothetical protein
MKRLRSKVIENLPFLSLLCIVCLFLIFPFDSYGMVVNIQDILVTGSADSIVVYARLTDCFTKEMESVILAGVPTTFSFILDTYQERSFWFDKKISQIIINHTIKYDSVKQTFFVASSDSREPAVFQDFESAKRAMSDLNGIVVAPMRQVSKDKAYYVMIKAKLEKTSLPSSMEYMFISAALGDFETDWYRRGLVF